MGKGIERDAEIVRLRSEVEKWYAKSVALQKKLQLAEKRELYYREKYDKLKGECDGRRIHEGTDDAGDEVADVGSSDGESTEERHELPPRLRELIQVREGAGEAGVPEAARPAAVELGGARAAELPKRDDADSGVPGGAVEPRKARRPRRICPYGRSKTCAVNAPCLQCFEDEHRRNLQRGSDE